MFVTQELYTAMARLGVLNITFVHEETARFRGTLYGHPVTGDTQAGPWFNEQLIDLETIKLFNTIYRINKMNSDALRLL
jgi:hypothetical protein